MRNVALQLFHPSQEFGSRGLLHFQQDDGEDEHIAVVGEKADEVAHN